MRCLYLLRRIPAAAVPRLSRQQEVRASQRVHSGVCRPKVRQVRRFRYDTLPALLKEKYRGIIRARACARTQPAQIPISLNIYDHPFTNLRLYLRCYEGYTLRYTLSKTRHIHTERIQTLTNRVAALSHVVRYR